MRVIMLKPGKAARVEEIGEELEDLQQAVGGGYIEAFYPFKDEACMVVNDEGKFNGMRPCRAVYADDGELMDVVFGPCFICGLGEEDFCSLTDEQVEKYSKMFEYPEDFYMFNGSIQVVRYKEGD